MRGEGGYQSAMNMRPLRRGGNAAGVLRGAEAKS